MALLPAGAVAAEDKEPPHITGLTIEPAEVDTSAADQQVTVKAHITDNLAGFESGTIAFISPGSSPQQVFGAFSSSNRISGTATDGVYKTTVTFKRFSEAGTWKVNVVRLNDSVKNQSETLWPTLAEMGLPYTVVVQGGEVEDTQPPELLSLSIEPTEVKVGSEDAEVIIRTHVRDEPSGVRFAEVGLISSDGSQASATSSALVEGDYRDGFYRAQLSIPAYTKASEWTVNYVQLKDRAGNEKLLRASDLREAGFPYSLQVTSDEPKEDTQPPEVLGFSIKPQEIDTTAGPQTATVTVHLADNLSGVLGVGMEFISPSGSQSTGTGLSLTEGTTTNGIYTGTATFPQFSETGTWKVLSLIAYDKAGNVLELEAGGLAERGLPDSVQVNSEQGEADADAPRIDELSFEPAAVDTTSSGQTVIVNAHITDNLSGFYKGYVQFQSPSGKSQTSGSFERISGDADSGTYRAKVPFEHFSEAGGWNATVVLVDSAFNESRLGFLELKELELPHILQVESEASEEPEEEPQKDTQPPQLKKVSVEPTEVDTSAGKQTVFVNVLLADNESGFKSGEIVFESPGHKQDIESTGFRLLSGSETEGIYRFEVPFPSDSEEGDWEILKVRLRDHDGNEGITPGAEIEGAHAVDVINKGEEPHEDKQPPELKDLSIEPTEIDTSTSAQTVFVDLAVNDESGLAASDVVFFSPLEKDVIGFLKLISGSETEGVYRAEVPFPQGAEVGDWNIYKINLRDKAGNENYIPGKEVEGAGFPHTVHVVSGPPNVTQVNPSSGGEAGGREVQISGSRLGGATAVRFGSRPATSFTVGSPSVITATVPPGHGTVDVTVSTPAGTSATSLADQFVYAPEVSLASTPNPSAHGQQVTLTAKVTPTGEGAPTPVGTITFLDGGNTLKVANMSKGSATFKTTALGAGGHKLSALYSGDAYFGQGGSEAVFQVVNKAATEASLTSSLNPAPYGSSATLKATVEAIAPGSGTPAGTVTFQEGESVLDTVQLSGKNATLSLKTLPPGTHQIIATYSGDANNESSKSPPLTQTITQASTTIALTSSLNPAPSGSSATLKATVDAIAPAVGTPDGTVTFHEGPEVLATVPLSGSGVAQYSLKAAPPGNYEITATYNGNATYEGSESSLGQVVTKASTELALTSSLNPAPYGSSATLKATVDSIAPGGGTPDGVVTFAEGKNVLATVPLSSSGIAKYALKTTPPGEYKITANYTGDANYASSEATLGQAITKASTELTLTSTKNPAPKGSSGNLKATVKAISPGSGTPPGTVTFQEGSEALATVPLSGNTATLPLKTLAVGTHAITAIYSGSANYESSEGAITQVISP
ncbi:MAG TPA: Ig-like domain repeat protein [Fimbriimonas sp.]|nr:Ig-like domain repeat protein [Fimbriimonas sp.]